MAVSFIGGGRQSTYPKKTIDLLQVTILAIITEYSFPASFKSLNTFRQILFLELKQVYAVSINGQMKTTSMNVQTYFDII